MTHPQAPARPDGIPQDVWDAAWKAYWGNIAGDITEPSILANARLQRIAHAIASERKRCADAALRHAENWERSPEGIVPRNVIDTAVRSALSIVTLIEAGGL